MQLDAARAHAFSVLFSADTKFANVTRLRFKSEMVTVPWSVMRSESYFNSTAYPDLVMGVPIGKDRCGVVRIRTGLIRDNESSTGRYTMLSLAGSVPATDTAGAHTTVIEGGLENFVSMAFSALGDLFAVDEQPALWRWKADNSTESGFSNTAIVQMYIHPSRGGVWKIMAWSNHRTVLVSDTSVSLWTQCMRCPDGMVTPPSDPSDVQGTCVCPAGQFMGTVNFRRQCLNQQAVSWWLLPNVNNCCVCPAGRHSRRGLCCLHITKGLRQQADCRRPSMHRQRCV